MPDGPQYDLSTAVQDPDFLKADMRDKIAFLSAHDSDFAAASVKDKLGYLNHILPTGQSQQQPETGLTSSSNPKLQEWAQNHPVAGPILRFLDATGGAALSTPESIVKGIKDVAQSYVNPQSKSEVASTITEGLKGWADPKVRAGALSVLPEALGQGAGSVAGGEAVGAASGAALSKLPSVGEIQNKLGQIVRDPATGKVKSPYEIAVDKLVPDPYAPNAIPAKTIPKGTNFGQFLEAQKAANKVQVAKDAYIARRAAAADADAQDLITRTQKLVQPGEAPSAADLKRAGDLTQAPLPRLQALAKFGDKLAQNEINRRLKNP